MIFLDLIAKKRDGESHSAAELDFIARAAAQGLVPDYQLSAWLMAATCRGMDRAETIALTRAMARSGQSLGLGRLGRKKVDKHSTGGVGDGVSLVLAPLAAACGLVVPMMSGRGLGHTGGTLDKLESIPGFRVDLPLSRIRSQVRRLGACLFGQNAALVPADKALYALRDATATVPSRSLIVASILSKKMTEGLDGLVLDVKVGSGAVYRDAKDSRALARELIRTAKAMGMPTVAVLTAMDQPLGYYIGNAHEMYQALKVLGGDSTPEDYLECVRTLGGWMLKLGGRARSAEHGADLIQEKIDDHSGLKLFRAIVKAQGGDARMVDEPDRLLERWYNKKSRIVRSPREGYLAGLDAEKIGRASVALGAGRTTKDDAIDFGAGIRLFKKIGDYVWKGEPNMLLKAATDQRLEDAAKECAAAIKIVAKPPRRPKVVIEVLR